MHSGGAYANIANLAATAELTAGRCFLEQPSREAVLLEAVLLRRRGEEPALEEGPDSLCRTRKAIQPERTMIRSNL